jgi:hypothetical protein
MVIICLVEKHVFSILNLAIYGVLFQDARWTDPVLSAELFPKLTSNYIAKFEYFDFRIDLFEL